MDPITPKMTNGLFRHIKVEEYTSIQRVKVNMNEYTSICLPAVWEHILRLPAYSFIIIIIIYYYYYYFVFWRMIFLRCALKRKVLRTTGKSSYIALTLIEIDSQNEYGHLHEGVPINPLYTGRLFH